MLFIVEVKIIIDEAFLEIVFQDFANKRLCIRFYNSYVYDSLREVDKLKLELERNLTIKCYMNTIEERNMKTW